MDNRLETEYWATLPDTEIAREMISHVEKYLDFVYMTRLSDDWRRSYQLYYGRDASWGTTSSSRVSYGGQSGELALLRVNKFRVYLERLLMLITSNKPTLVPRAINSDSASQSQAEVGKGILGYFFRKEGGEDLLYSALENAFLFGEGWVLTAWDPYKGNAFAVDPETGREVKTGELRVEVFEPVNVIRAFDTRLEKQNWHIVRSMRNKWDLAADFPKFRDDIVRHTDIVGNRFFNVNLGFQRKESDQVEVHELFHKRTSALPEGRYTLIVGDRVLVDGPLPYRDYPLHPVVPLAMKGSGFGYSRAIDMMGLQEAVDSVASNVLTAHDAFGLPNIWLPTGSSINVSDLAGGLKVITSDDKPELINMLDIGGDYIRAYDLFNNAMMEMLGINEVTLGQSQEGVRSSSQSTMLIAQAHEFNARSEAEWAKAHQAVATRIINTLQDFASEPILLGILGKRDRTILREFKGAEIESICRIDVELEAPELKSTAGKLEMVSQFVALANTKNGETVSPKQLLDVFLTGKLGPVEDYPDSQRLLVARENEMLAEGQMVEALFTDDHAYHIREHSVETADPELRAQIKQMLANPQIDPTLTGVPLLDHIQQHINLLMTTNPNVLRALNQDPPLMPPPVAGAMAGGQAPDAQAQAPAPGMNPGADNVPLPPEGGAQ